MHVVRRGAVQQRLRGGMQRLRQRSISREREGRRPEQPQRLATIARKGIIQDTEGQASCLPCLPGEFGNETGLLQCHKCAIGTVSETSKSTNCTECNAGQSSDSKGSAKCTSCGAGQYSNVSGVECKDCAKGRYRVNEKDEDQNNPKTCDDCPHGYFQDTEGQASCLPCLPGEFGNETGLLQCHKCAIGTVSETSKSTELHGV